MVDPNEMDSQGFGPQVGSPVIHLPDGRRLAISVFDVFIFRGVGAMAYEYNVGAYLWKIVDAPYAIWQTDTASPEVPLDQTLEGIIAANGGPANFILNTMNYSGQKLAAYLGFNPQWPANNNLTNEVVNAMTGWELKAVVPGNPLLVTLPRFKA